MQKEAARDIIIVDTTLRDGEQMPGVAFNVEEKIAIAKLLDKIGVHIIEVGIPVMGGEEKIAVQKIIQAGLKAQVTTWNRIVLSDLRASIQCGARYLHLSAPVSDLLIEKKLGKTRQWVLRCLQGAIRYAADYGCTISVGAEDASRAEFNFLAEYAQLAAEYGAVRLRYADTVGIMEPFSVYRLIKNLIDIVDIDIEIHTHNDFGLSTANSL
ncbi:MAG: homocitrate synthase NifV, partial [Clostridia bacterium]|nr:homocitrate synthase NifV [Clostridia bacterium]